MTFSKSRASRRYVIRMAVLMSAYLVLFAAAGYWFRHARPQGLLAYLAAVAPALPIIGVFWAVMRLVIEETDEFVKLLHVRQCLVATGFCLTVMTIWEFLQNFDLVAPGNGGFGAAFFWFVGLGVGACYNRFTLGAASCAL